ncbi:MAG: hypothetical protein ACE5IO_03040 [Thermoplasmata archaeon]
MLGGGLPLKRILALLVVNMFLIASFSMTTMAQIEMSDPTVGMTWTYDFDMDYGEVFLTGDMVLKIEEKTQLLGYDVYTISMNGGGSFTGLYTGTWTVSASTHKRLSDKATVREEGTMTMKYNYMDTTVTTTLEMVETNDPPIDMNDFPIELYETWKANTTRTTTTVYLIDGVEDFSDTETEFVEYEMECLGERTVTVPAGTYTGYELKLTREDGIYTLDVLSLDINASVISEDFESDGAKIGTMELVSYGMEEEEGFWTFEMLLLIAIVGTAVVMIAGIAVGVARRRRREEQPSLYDHEEEKPPYW